MIAGMLRVKNEARWIERVLDAALLVCDHVWVMDDHSTDETRELCRMDGVTVFESPFNGLDESRDKNWIYQRIFNEAHPRWILLVDGDEELLESDSKELKRALRNNIPEAYSLRIAYLWDREDQIRIDGIYRHFRRPSAFRALGPHLEFITTRNGGNFHCSSVPGQLLGAVSPLDVKLLHYGYMHREDRMKKWAWYNEHDPMNAQEDQYLHTIIGDVPELPPDTRTKWAGPLELERI